MRYIPILFCSILLITSCKKDPPEEIINTVGSVKEYFPLTPGSYWIYQQYKKDIGTGDFVASNILDSVYVYQDTVINGNTFTILRASGNLLFPHSLILRDSGDYLIDESGSIFLSSSNFTDTLYSYANSFVYTAYKMDDKDSVITTPAGTFPTINYKGFAHLLTDCPDTVRTIHNFYSKGIGRVKSATFYSSTFCLPEQLWVEDRLERYHIEE